MSGAGVITPMRRCKGGRALITDECGFVLDCLDGFSICAFAGKDLILKRVLFLDKFG